MTSMLNEYARDGWRVVGLSSNTYLGTSLSYDIIFERERYYQSNRACYQYEYEAYMIKKNLMNFIDEKAKSGWRVVAYCSSNTLGTTTSNYLVLEREI